MKGAAILHSYAHFFGAHFAERVMQLSDVLDKTTTPSRVLHHLRLILWLLLSLGVFRVGYILFASARLLHIPFESTKPEMYIFNGAQRLAEGEMLYRPLAEMPLIISVYNPLSYFPGFIARAIPFDSRSMHLLGRYVSYVSSLALAALLFLWIRHLTSSVPCAVFCAFGLLYYQAITLTDCFRLRPESPGLLLTFVAVAVVLSSYPGKLYLAALLFFAAWLFKQSFIAAPISVFLFLLFTRQFRSAFLFASTLGGLIVVFLIAMYRITGERYFQNTFVALAVNEIHPVSAIMNVYGKYLWSALYGVLLASPVALYILIRMRTHLFFVIYFMISLVWAVYSAGKLGAQVNYYSEFAIAGLIIISLAARVPLPRFRIFSFLPAVLIAGQVLFTIVLYGPFGAKVDCAYEDLSPYLDRYPPGNNLIVHEGIAAHTGQITGLDWVLLEHLWEKGKVDLEPILLAVARGQFTTIVISQHPATRFEMRVLHAVRTGPYKLKDVDDIVSEWILVKGKAP